MKNNKNKQIIRAMVYEGVSGVSTFRIIFISYALT